MALRGSGVVFSCWLEPVANGGAEIPECEVAVDGLVLVSVAVELGVGHSKPWVEIIDQGQPGCKIDGQPAVNGFGAFLLYCCVFYI